MSDKPTTVEAPEHARLAPSSAYRWTECPGSVRETAKYPGGSSPYADEGSMLHECMAYLLQRMLMYPPGDTRRGTLFTPGDVWPYRGTDYVLTVEQVAALDACRAYAENAILAMEKRRVAYEVLVEQRLPLSEIDTGMFGTSDLIFLDYDSRVITVVDWKFGVGVKVFARGNKQLILYGIAAYLRYELFAEFDRIEVVVVQPRLNHVDAAEVLTADVPGLVKRFRQEAEATHAQDAPLKAGDWCIFCPAKPHCPAVREKAVALVDSVFDAFGELNEPISVAESSQIAQVLAQAKMIRGYLDAVEEEAAKRLREGLPVPGWKLVAGRGSRVWTSVEDAERAYGADLYEKKVRSPAQMEELCKENDAQFFPRLVANLEGKPTLAPESDKRPAIKSAEAVFGVIADDNVFGF